MYLKISDYFYIYCIVFRKKSNKKIKKLAEKFILNIVNGIFKNTQFVFATPSAFEQNFWETRNKNYTEISLRIFAFYFVSCALKIVKIYINFYENVYNVWIMPIST